MLTLEGTRAALNPLALTTPVGGARDRTSHDGPQRSPLLSHSGMRGEWVVGEPERGCSYCLGGGGVLQVVVPHIHQLAQSKQRR